jgi:hypothetical protein
MSQAYIGSIAAHKIQLMISRRTHRTVTDTAFTIAYIST